MYLADDPARITSTDVAISIQVHHAGARHLASAEQEQLPGELGRAQCGLANLLDVGALGRSRGHASPAAARSRRGSR